MKHPSFLNGQAFEGRIQHEFTMFTTYKYANCVGLDQAKCIHLFLNGKLIINYNIEK